MKCEIKYIAKKKWGDFWEFITIVFYVVLVLGGTFLVFCLIPKWLLENCPILAWLYVGIIIMTLLIVMIKDGIKDTKKLWKEAKDNCRESE